MTREHFDISVPFMIATCCIKRCSCSYHVFVHPSLTHIMGTPYEYTTPCERVSVLSIAKRLRMQFSQPNPEGRQEHFLELNTIEGTAELEVTIFYFKNSNNSFVWLNSISLPLTDQNKPHSQSPTLASYEPSVDSSSFASSQRLRSSVINREVQRSTQGTFQCTF